MSVFWKGAVLMIYSLFRARYKGILYFVDNPSLSRIPLTFTFFYWLMFTIMCHLERLAICRAICPSLREAIEFATVNVLRQKLRPPRGKLKNCATNVLNLTNLSWTIVLNYIQFEEWQFWIIITPWRWQGILIYLVTYSEPLYWQSNMIDTVFWVYHVLNHNVFRRCFERYFSHHQAKCELKLGFFARRAMVDQAREGLCYQKET